MKNLRVEKSEFVFYFFFQLGLLSKILFVGEENLFDL